MGKMFKPQNKDFQGEHMKASFNSTKERGGAKVHKYNYVCSEVAVMSFLVPTYPALYQSKCL